MNKLIKNLNLVLILLILEICIKGCIFIGCEIIKLPTKEKKYFKESKLDENFIFKSNLGRFDTLKVVKLYDRYTSCNKWERSNYQYNKNYIALSSSLSNGKIYINYTINYLKEIERGFNFKDLYGYFYDDEIKECIERVKISSFKDSLECYTFNTSNSKSDYNGIIKSFSWNKEHGFLRYETKEGEVFELQK
jgi:hypothetical protein